MLHADTKLSVFFFLHSHTLFAGAIQAYKASTLRTKHVLNVFCCRLKCNLYSSQTLRPISMALEEIGPGCHGNELRSGWKLAREMEEGIKIASGREEELEREYARGDNRRRESENEKLRESEREIRPSAWKMKRQVEKASEGTPNKRPRIKSE